MTKESPVPKGERTAQEILQAAYELFTSQGYHGTSMRQIAQTAGIALGGIYNHFASKEEIFHQVFLDYHPYNQFLPAMLASADKPLEEFIRDALDSIIHTIDDNPGFLNLMFIEVVEFNGKHIREIFTRAFPQGVKIAQRLSTKAQFRDLPLLIVIRYVIGLLFSYYMTEKLIVSVAPPEFRENAAVYFTDMVLHGILAEPSPSALSSSSEEQTPSAGS